MKDFKKSEDEICSEMRISNTDIKRFFKDLNMEYPFNYLNKTKRHNPIRYFYNDGEYVRDQFGEYVYSTKLKKFIKYEYHKETKKEKQENIDEKRNEEFIKFETMKFETKKHDESLAKGVGKPLTKASTKPKPRNSDSAGRTSDKIAGGIVISDEAIEMANKYI